MRSLAVASIAASLLGVSAGEGPCDIYAAAGFPCVAAHSTVRALFASYSGPLYQVQRLTDNATADVAVLAPGGIANAATQDAFCGRAVCVISRFYDQTENANHLSVAPVRVSRGNGTDIPVNASRDALVVGGERVYSAFFEGGMGYRNDQTRKMPVGDEAQTIYMVVSGLHYNDQCCFDFGNAELEPKDDGPGTMEAVYFGSAKGGLNHGGAGPGPWVMADLEKGLWGSNVTDSNEPTISHAFVTAMAKGDTGAKPGHFAIKGGNAQAGELTTYWDGPRPTLLDYSPMKKQGAIILGVGGDNSDGSVGTFYEGVIVAGYTTDAADNAVQANIVAAGYALK